MENSREMGRVQLYTRPDQPGQLQSWQVQKCGGFLAWFKGGTPPGFWTTTASVLLQVIEMKGDAKDTPVDQGVDHVDHPWHKDAGSDNPPWLSPSLATWAIQGNPKS